MLHHDQSQLTIICIRHYHISSTCTYIYELFFVDILGTNLKLLIASDAYNQNDSSTETVDKVTCKNIQFLKR